MTAIAKEKLEISDTLIQLYQEMAVSPVMLLTNYALSHIHAKIQKYTAENASFEKKIWRDASKVQKQGRAHGEWREF